MNILRIGPKKGPQKGQRIGLAMDYFIDVHGLAISDPRAFK